MSQNSNYSNRITVICGIFFCCPLEKVRVHYAGCISSFGFLV
uniref:Uncharacterized protein n=2 Tax=Anguilla anguilla TaxID=7936 RepID=A0A0E9S0V4_ANGAN